MQICNKKAMKKLIVTSIVFFLVAYGHAQTWNLTAYEYAYKTKSYNVWTDWSDWTDCDIRIKVNSQKIVIYSNATQIYDVISLISSDGTTFKWQCNDWRGVNCIIRFEIKTKGTQIYVSYSDAKWVYNVTM